MKNIIFGVFVLAVVLFVSGCTEDPQLAMQKTIACDESGCSSGGTVLSDTQPPVIQTFNVNKTVYPNSSVYTVVQSGSATDNVGIYKMCIGYSFVGIPSNGSSPSGGGGGHCSILSTPVKTYTYYSQTNYTQPGNYSFSLTVYDIVGNNDSETRKIVLP